MRKRLEAWLEQTRDYHLARELEAGALMGPVTAKSPALARGSATVGHQPTN